MKKLFLLLMFTLLFGCIQTDDSSDFLFAQIINYWYEPVYEETEYGNYLKEYYEGHICIVLHEDGYAYFINPKYGLYAYPWCISSDDQVIIDERAVDFNYISSDYLEISVNYKLIKIDGVLTYCYSEPDTWLETPFEGALSTLECE